MTAVYDRDELSDSESSAGDKKQGNNDDTFNTQYGSEYGSDTPGHYWSDSRLNPANRQGNKKPEKDELENLVGKGHTGDGGDESATARLLHNKKFWVGAGGGIFALVVTGAIFLGFLNVFKLDALMSNIEQRAFLRHNASLNTRSSKWISAYITARMLEFNDSPDIEKNTLFRSNRVDTNSPFTDWYRTMRLSKFEDELYRSKGIKFTSVIGPDNKIRTGLISINGEQPIRIDNISQADITGIERGDVAALNKFEGYVDIEKFDNNKDARRAIKRVVNENTHFLQVYKRRALRKSLQNVTGVRDWRFFENTRDKATKKRVDIRNRMLDKMLPDPNSSIVGRVTRCIFGINKCNASRDVVDPKNLATTTGLIGTENPDNQTDVEKQNEAQLAAASLDEAGFSDALKKILAQANILARVLNIPQTLDMLSYVNDGMTHLVKYVVLARGAQAAGLFQVFETARDQLKSGQVQPEEVNALMQNINSAASSDGWVKVVEGKGDPGTASTEGACSQESQAAAEKDPNSHQNDYAPLCADQRIGNAANGAKLQSDYTQTIGRVVGPIASAWSGIKGSPFGVIINVIEWIGNFINGIVSAIVHSILSILGLDHDVKVAIQWVFAKLSNFLGLTILKGYEGAGTTYNWLVQGGAYSAEGAGRHEGAAKTTADSQAAVEKQVAIYQSEEQNNMSAHDKLLSLDNPDSIASKSVFAVSNVRPGNFIGSLFNALTNIPRGVASVFNGHSKAAEIDGYAASKFADIETYDYPQKCYDLDPIYDDDLNTPKPLDGTNVLAVLANPRAYGYDHDAFPISSENYALLSSWDVETNSELFYKTVYDIVGEDTENVDDLIVQIYNCNLLDTAVRGSLGNLYGYTKDNGLEETPGTITPGTPPSTTCTLSGIPYAGQYTQQQLTQIFGNPGTMSSHPEMDNNLTSVDFLGHSVSINKLVAPCLSAVVQEIKTSGIKYTIKEIGCYRYDPDSPPTNIGLRSYHTYGAACDINWSTNPFVSGGTAPYDMPQQYIDAFNHYGFKWGGTFNSIKDYMHFEWHGVTP